MLSSVAVASETLTNCDDDDDDDKQQHGQPQTKNSILTTSCMCCSRSSISSISFSLSAALSVMTSFCLPAVSRCRVSGVPNTLTGDSPPAGPMMSIPASAAEANAAATGATTNAANAAAAADAAATAPCARARMRAPPA